MSKRGRTVVAVLIILCGLAIVAGSRLGWVKHAGSRPASGIQDTAVTGLLHWSYQPCNTYFNSFSFVVLLCGILVVLGALLASRMIVGLFALLTLLAGGLWIALNISHYKAANLAYQDLRIGAWLTFGGAIVALICWPFLRRRRRML
jgi:hypothetical protein